MIYHYEGRAWFVNYQWMKDGQFEIWLTNPENEDEAIDWHDMTRDDQDQVYAIVLDYVQDQETRCEFDNAG